jgi:large subunit ribosomal protein L21
VPIQQQVPELIRFQANRSGLMRHAPAVFDVSPDGRPYDGSFESPGSETMFAIIEDGSHQYRVEPGQSLTVDFRSEANAGDTIEFDRVLLANGGGSSAVGRPTIEGATVTTEVITPELKGKKLEIQKFRRRKNSRKHTGHRQKYTEVKITAINVPGLEVVETAAAAE